MTPTDMEHAVFETSRHGDGGAEVQIVGAFGTLGIVVPAGGHSERMTEPQKVEAMRHALAAMAKASALLEKHLDRIAPGSSAAKPTAPVPAGARPA